jgi:hypothetical protein
MTRAPVRGNWQTITPVSTDTPVAFSSTRTGFAGRMGSFTGTISNGPSPGPELADIACAVHFKEPSGQYASGQVCSGRRVPVGPRTEKWVVSWCFPGAQGVPHVMPVGTAGAFPSSQHAQAPGPGFVSATSGDIFGRADVAANSEVRGRAAEPEAPAAMNCRREIGLVISIPRDQAIDSEVTDTQVAFRRANGEPTLRVRVRIVVFK